MTRRDNVTTALAVMVLLAATIPAGAQDTKEVSRVVLTVFNGVASARTSGTLFRAYADRREYVADIGEDGSTSPKVKCASTEKFEAESESKLDRPVAPQRISCKEQLAFSFTRMFVLTLPTDTSTQLASSSAGPKVFAQYADIFAAAGKTTAAKTWNDAAKFSAAKSLGDAKTDKYLYRDPTKGYELLFNADGVAALKEKQAKLGIKVTGKLDAETVNALAKLESSQQVIAGMHCKARSAGTQYFQCDPSNAAPPPGPQVVVVPKVPLN